MEDSTLPFRDFGNDDYASTGARLELSVSMATIAVGTTELEINGECIDVFGLHTIDAELTPGGTIGSFTNACDGNTFSVVADISQLTLTAGSRTLRLKLMNEDLEMIHSVSIPVTVTGGSTSISCPGGGTHQYNGLAPDSIRNKARQAAEAVNTQYPGLISQACPAKRGSGNNDFLYRVVQRLRQDPVDGFRWGLNGKRGDANDMSQDVVDYYWGPGTQPAGRLETYLFDVIVACEGPSPSPAATDVTLPDVCGRWILPSSYPY